MVGPWKPCAYEGVTRCSAKLGNIDLADTVNSQLMEVTEIDGVIACFIFMVAFLSGDGLPK